MIAVCRYVRACAIVLSGDRLEIPFSSSSHFHFVDSPGDNGVVGKVRILAPWVAYCLNDPSPRSKYLVVVLLYENATRDSDGAKGPAADASLQ